MSRGKKAFLVSPILALAIAFMWASPAPAELTVSGSVAAVDDRVPDPASNLQVEVDLGAPSVALSWDLSASDFVRQTPVGLDFTSGGSYVNTNDVSAYNIWRDDGGGFELIDSVPAGQGTYVDESVDSGVTYTYQVTAFDGTNESDPIEGGPVSLGPPPTAVIVPTDDIDFGVSGPSESATASIGVSNVAADPEAILSVRLTVEGNGFSVSDDLTLAIGEDGVIDVSFAAGDVGNKNGAYEGTLTIKTNDPDNRETIIALSASVEGGVDAPRFDVNVVSLSFSNRLLDSLTEKGFVVTNKGGETLEVEFSIVGDAAFTLGSDLTSATLEPGETTGTVSFVIFAPTDEVDYSASLVMTSNDPDAPEVSISLSGTGVLELPDEVRVEVDAEGNQLVGFLNDDDEVNLFDFFLFADAFGKNPGEDGFLAGADFDGDGVVGLFDFFLFADSFGKTPVL